MLKVENNNVNFIWNSGLDIEGLDTSYEARQNGTAYQLRPVERNSQLKSDWDYRISRNTFTIDVNLGKHNRYTIKKVDLNSIEKLEDIESFNGRIGTFKYCVNWAKKRIRQDLSSSKRVYFDVDNHTYLCIQYSVSDKYLGIDTGSRSSDYIEYELSDLICEDIDFVGQDILRLRLGSSSRNPDGTYERIYQGTLYVMDKDWVVISINNTDVPVTIVNDGYIEEFLINYER